VRSTTWLFFPLDVDISKGLSQIPGAFELVFSLEWISSNTKRTSDDLPQRSATFQDLGSDSMYGWQVVDYIKLHTLTGYCTVTEIRYPRHGEQPAGLRRSQHAALFHGTASTVVVANITNRQWVLLDLELKQGPTT
jgi:hypothetical protein